MADPGPTPAPINAPAKRPWQDIPTLVPPEAGPERIKADNLALRQALTQQTGTFAGKQQDAYGQWWERRNLGTPDRPNFMLMRRSPNDPYSLEVQDMGSGGIHTEKLGGPTFAPLLDNLRSTLSQSAENPLTGQRWEKDPMQADYGTLRSYQQQLERGKQFRPATGEEMSSLSQANKIAGYLRDAKRQYDLLGGKDGLNQLAQFMGNMQSSTDVDNWLGGQGKDPKRDAYLAFMRDYSKAAEYGIDFGNFVGKQQNPGDVASSIGNTVGHVTEALGFAGKPMKAIAAGGVGIAADLLKSVFSGDVKADAVRAQLDSSRADLNRTIYDQVRGLSDPATAVRLPEYLRDYGRNAMAEMKSMGLQSPDDDVASIPVAPARPDLEAAAKNPVAQTAQAGQSTQPWFKMPGIISGSYGGSLTGAAQQTREAERGKGILQQQYNNPPPAAPLKPAPQNQAVPQNQPAQVASNPESGAPLGADRGIPRLHQQGDVDKLGAGERFYWKNHDRAYVKV